MRPVRAASDPHETATRIQIPMAPMCALNSRSTPGYHSKVIPLAAHHPPNLDWRCQSLMKNFRFRGMGPDLALGRPQFISVAFGICALLLIEWILETRLITTANGTHFATTDGKMFEAVVQTAYRFAAWLNVTNLNPLQGVGSQMFPLNVWVDPVYWPLAFLDGKLAT